MHAITPSEIDEQIAPVVEFDQLDRIAALCDSCPGCHRPPRVERFGVDRFSTVYLIRCGLGTDGCPLDVELVAHARTAAKAIERWDREVIDATDRLAESRPDLQAVHLPNREVARRAFVALQGVSTVSRERLAAAVWAIDGAECADHLRGALLSIGVPATWWAQVAVAIGYGDIAILPPPAVTCATCGCRIVFDDERHIIRDAAGLLHFACREHRFVSSRGASK